MHLTPTEVEVKQILEKEDKNGPYLLSVKHELLADLETPVSAFYKVCNNKPYSFLLESVEGNEKLGRYSLIGTEPILLLTNKTSKTFLENKIENKTTEIEENPFVALKNILNTINIIDSDTKDFLGFVGYFGYENIRWIEPKIGAHHGKPLHSFKAAPDVCLMLPGKIVIFDHILHKVSLISNVLLKDKNEVIKKYSNAKQNLELLLRDFNQLHTHTPLSLKYDTQEKAEYKSNYKKEDFIAMIKKGKEYIYKGDIFQVVLSQKFSVGGKHDGFLLYRALRSINPSPYLFYLNLKDFEIAGSSPEVMVKCINSNSKKLAYLRPIAGTYPRGKDEIEDLKNISKLQNDPKEKAEHLMLIDLARNDLGRVCEPGSINVSELMVIEKYSHVLHMVSQVEGNLKADETSIDLLSACFPAGTLSGAPKVRAMEIINELEKEQRGPYGGCLGFFGLNDTINTAMTIRTFIIYKDHLEIQAGAGIVADSNPEKEYEETLRKGAALLRAISLL